MANTVKEQRDVEPFGAVVLEGIGTVEFVQGPQIRVEIEAEPDALALIVTEVRNRTLHIETKLKDKKVIAYRHPPVFRLTAPDLARFELRGAGRAKIDRLATESLKVAVDGAGDIQLKEQQLDRMEVSIAGAGSIKAEGAATAQDILIKGTGSFSGEKLTGAAVTVSIPGAGQAKVHAAQELTASIGGLGQISYHGDPKVHATVEGLGRIKRA